MLSPEPKQEEEFTEFSMKLEQLLGGMCSPLATRMNEESVPWGGGEEPALPLVPHHPPKGLRYHPVQTLPLTNRENRLQGVTPACLWPHGY